MKIYAACLASYNAGILHGAWIDATQGADGIRDDIAEMLRASPYPNVRVTCPTCDGDSAVRAAVKLARRGSIDSACCTDGTVPSAEEYAIHDYDDLPSSWGEHPDIDKVGAYAEAMDELDTDEEREGFRLLLDDRHGEEPDVERFREVYRGCWPTFRDYAENFADDIGLLEGAPEMLERYFDWESWARDLRHDFTTRDGDHGVHVFDDHA